MPYTLDSRDIDKMFSITYMHDVHMNSVTPIFKIRILEQIVSHDFLK